MSLFWCSLLVWMHCPPSHCFTSGKRWKSFSARSLLYTRWSEVNIPLLLFWMTLYKRFEFEFVCIHCCFISGVSYRIHVMSLATILLRITIPNSLLTRESIEAAMFTWQQLSWECRQGFDSDRTCGKRDVQSFTTHTVHLSNVYAVWWKIENKVTIVNICINI